MSHHQRTFYAGGFVLLLLLPALGIPARAQSRLAATNAFTFPSTALVSTTNRGAVLPSQYVLQPNDVISLKVYQEDDLETKAKVNRDGLVTIPLIGPVVLSGKTVEEATHLIRDLLDKRFVVNPQVSLTVVEYSKRRFTILGQVQRTGVYEYSGDEKVTVLQAIAMAGGFTRLGDPSKVVVQRMEKGHPRVFKIDAEAVLKNPWIKPFEVQSEDMIRVGSRLFSHGTLQRYFRKRRGAVGQPATGDGPAPDGAHHFGPCLDRHHGVCGSGRAVLWLREPLSSHLRRDGDGTGGTAGAEALEI